MRSKPKVVIDTNIFIDSWFRDETNANAIMELLETNKIKLFMSQETIGELIYVMKKYCIKNMSSFIPRQQLLHWVSDIFLNSTSTDTRETICPIVLDDLEDDKIAKCAIEAKVDYLVTQDRKSGMFDLNDINVVDSKEFIDIYNRLQNVAMGE